jgi:hypothetical protein
MKTSEKVDVSLEDLNKARRLYRRLLLNFFVIGVGGLFAGMYLVLFPIPGIPNIAGIGIGEWVLIVALFVTLLLTWSQTYKISRLLKNYTIFFTVILLPFMIVMIQIAIAQAAQRAGYRMGPFLGSLRSIEK